MASQRNRRIAKELADLQADTHSKITVQPAGSADDLTHLKGSFKGPGGTPYEGGTYVIDIRLNSEYPFKAPKMTFDTKIWHPNVSSQTGAICLDTLSTAWSPILTLKSALLSLQSLLNEPEPNDPQDAQVANMMLTSRPEFDRVAQEWAVKHAGAPPPRSTQVGETSGGATKETLKNAGKKSREDEEREEAARYHGFPRRQIDSFVNMGFDLERVVSAFEFVGVEDNGGEDYEMEEAYMGDITARLLGEP